MKLALLGYGKMGKAIEQEALKRGHEIVAKIDVSNRSELKNLNSGNCDALIEFTHPDAFFGNLQDVLEQGIPMVTGTTGWQGRVEEVKKLVLEKRTAFLHSSNFSVGVNILFLLNKRLAELMDKYPEYDCYIEEQHHRYKADAPSGTAMSLGKQVLEGLKRKARIATDALLNRPPQEDELSIGYVRSGEIIGKHKVSYTSDIDEISITHQAYNRRGFALGAVLAAEWMPGKTGFFEFSDIFS